MSKSTWTGGISSDWNDPDNWNPVGVPGVNSDVAIASGTSVASVSIGTVNSITDSSDLFFESAGTNAVTTSLDNTGHLHVDAKVGEGGTILNIGETLTNSGSLRVGNATLSAPDTVTAASLDNTGEIRLLGSAADQALLDVNSAAGFGTAGVVSGSVYLTGDSAIEFASGEITSLAANAQLHLNGNDAFIEDGTTPGSNSALTRLASIGSGAVLGLHNEASVSTSGSLVNDGTIRLDYDGGDGGSSLTLAGALTNSGSLRIGNATLSAPDEVTAAALDNTRGEIFLLGSTTDQALLDVNSSAGFGTGGILSGYARLVGDSAIEFKSGQITSVATGADLTLNGNDAFIEDSTALGSNSALAGLSNVAGTLDLENGAKVSTTGALAIATYGFVDLDVLRRDGGSSLTLTGALTNSGTLLIGNASLSAPDQVTAASLDNTGVIVLRGSSANQALLDVTGSAGFGTAAVLSGNVSLSGDSAIEFKSGQITTIAASSSLELDGNDAFIEDSTALGSNSALTGLTSIGAGALLDLNNGASASTTGALVNYGNVELDYPGSVGGSSLTVGGTLTNNGSISITYDTEELAGAVGGAGGFSLEQGNLQFDSSVSSGQTITETGADALILEQAQKFGGTISNSGTGDTIDAANFLLSGTSFNFHENTAGTGGTLTLTDGSLTANISMTGVYTKSDFTLAPDSGTGTLVKFV